MTKLSWLNWVQQGPKYQLGSLEVIRGQTRVVFDPNRPFIGSDADNSFEIFDVIFEILAQKIFQYS